jgi:hypothetical protein
MMITIATFTTEIDAEILRQNLETSGIKAVVFKDDCGGMRPHMQLTCGVQVKVALEDVEKANDFMHSGQWVGETVEQDGPDIEKDIMILLNRARGWILLGFGILPSLIAFPVAFIYTSCAVKEFERRGLTNGELKRQAIRIRWVAALSAVVFWTAALVWVLRQPIQRLLS